MNIANEHALGVSSERTTCAQARRHRVVVASNVRLVREGLSRSLRGRDDLIVLNGVDLSTRHGAFADGESPDVAVVDTHGVDVMVVADDIRLAWPRAKLVAFAVAER